MGILLVAVPEKKSKLIKYEAVLYGMALLWCWNQWELGSDFSRNRIGIRLMPMHYYFKFPFLFVMVNKKRKMKTQICMKCSLSVLAHLKITANQKIPWRGWPAGDVDIYRKMSITHNFYTKFQILRVTESTDIPEGVSYVYLISFLKAYTGLQPTYVCLSD